MNLPEITRCVVLPENNSNLMRAMLSLKITEMLLPKMSENDVMIKVIASPINPSDIAFLQGGYNVVKPLPAIPGFEAMGEVIGAGENFKELIGTRVNCFSQDEATGCWSEYLVTSGYNCIRVFDELDLHQAATLSINPLTALGLMEKAKDNGSKNIIINAAGGVVPSFLRVLAEQNDMKTINIFRKVPLNFNSNNYPNHFKLCSSDENFLEKLYEILAEEENITAFDAVGGELSGILFNALPKNSQLVVYGGLSNEAIGNVDVLQMIFHNKNIFGFNLNDYIRINTKKGLLETIAYDANELVMNKTYRTPIQGEFALQDVVKGLRTYIKSMSAGKVLLLP